MTLRRLAWAAVPIIALLVVACGDSSSDGTSAKSSATTAKSGYPLTIQNCGRTLTFNGPPKRAVTTFQPTLEPLLALGLQDSIAGREDYTEGPILPEQKAAFDSIKTISKPSTFPTKEVMLSLHPDFVISDSLENFDASQGAATVEELEAAGAPVYIQTGRCKPGQNATFEDDYTDLMNLAKIFGVPERAAPVIARMKAKVAAVRKRLAGKKPVRLIFYDYKMGPLSLMTRGLSQVVEFGGGDNLTVSDKRIEVDVSVEQAVAENPAVVLLWDYGSKGNAESIKYLKSALKTTDAVKNNKLIPIEGAYTVPGYRTALGVEKVARILHPELFKEDTAGG
jgi:iron complex transport system substrate-binding protein